MWIFAILKRKHNTIHLHSSHGPIVRACKFLNWEQRESLLSCSPHFFRPSGEEWQKNNDLIPLFRSRAYKISSNRGEGPHTRPTPPSARGLFGGRLQEENPPEGMGGPSLGGGERNVFNLCFVKVIMRD